MAQTQHMEIWKKNSFSILLLIFFAQENFLYFSSLLCILYIFFYIFEFPLRHIHCVYTLRLTSRVREWTTFLFCCFLGMMKNAWFSYIKKSFFFLFFLCGRKFFSRDNFKHVLEKLEVKIFHSWTFSNNFRMFWAFLFWKLFEFLKAVKS